MSDFFTCFNCVFSCLTDVLFLHDSICQLAYFNSCCLTDPSGILRDSSVDAILPILGTLLPPADDACQEPSAFVKAGMWPPTVPLT